MSNRNKKIIGAILLTITVIGFVVVLSGRGGNSPATKLPAFLSEANEASSVTINTGARYVHTDKSFSFLYPEGFTPKLQSDGEDGEVVVLEDGEIGVQIAAIPFDEDIALTPERIKQDLPDLITERTEIVSVGGAQAVAFKSTNASTASSNEVWFVHAGKLYLVSAPSGSEALVSGIIKTWEF